MSYYELRYNLIRMWGKFGLKEIVTQNGAFLFKFKESEGMDFVLENGPWMVNNKPLIVQKWDPDVIIDKSDPKSLPCWIKLYNVPLEAWTVKGISTIASGLGKSLIMDKTTTKMCKGGACIFGYARVLVEIQVDKDFKEKLRFSIREKGNDKTQDGFRRVMNGFKSTTRMGNGEGQDKVQGKERKILWKNLGIYKRMIDDKPWVLMGDWNVSLHLEDHSEGGSSKTCDVIEFQEYLEHIKVEDLNCSGIHFTWVQSRQNPSSGILKKIDRVIGNVEFMSKFPNSHALFLPHLTSDHSPAVLIFPKVMNKKHKAFRFSNFIADKPDFLSIVQEHWNI
ncbi:RNA-directed DNA polymerase, eukaryota, reverse transcriptase zinc-binding domain protein [Tanacetum coccineum]